MTPRVLMLTADYVPGAWSGIGHAVAARSHALAALGVQVDVLLPAGDRTVSLYREQPCDGGLLVPPPASGGGGFGRFGPKTEGVTIRQAGDAAMLSDCYPPTSRLRKACAGRDLPPAEASGGQHTEYATGLTRGVTIHPLDGRRLPVDPTAFDIVHLHSLPLAELALEMRRRFGVPLVYTAHSQLRLELDNSPRAGMWQRLQETVMALADHVVVPSRSERTAALAHLPGIGRKITVVPHGVPTSDGRRMPQPGTGPVVFAGRFTRSKGIDVVAGLARRLAEVRPDLTVVVAGGHGDDESAALVADLVADHPATVVVPGWLPPAALRRLFAGAGVVVVPSRYEPFGMVALEAMAEGAPVLAAAVGGLVDIVTPASGGALVDSHDPDRWLSDVIALLDDPRRRGVLGERGPQHVAAHHDPLSLAAALRDDVYLPLLSPGRGVSDVA